MSQIIIGYTTEGPTDTRFLESILQRTFEEIAFECTRQIEVLPVINIDKGSGYFVEAMTNSLKRAYDLGIMIFCIHVDADAVNDDDVYRTRITPLLEKVEIIAETNICKNIVPIIPVQMTESWMLADRTLLKRELGATMADEELGIHQDPERISNPKVVIEEAIRISRSAFTKRRRRDLLIHELYQPIGQSIRLTELERLPSFQKFQNQVRNAFRKLNYLS